MFMYTVDVGLVPRLSPPCEHYGMTFELTCNANRMSESFSSEIIQAIVAQGERESLGTRLHMYIALYIKL